MLQSPSAVILEPKKIKSVTASAFSSAICKASSDSHFAFLHFFSMGMLRNSKTKKNLWNVIIFLELLKVRLPQNTILQMRRVFFNYHQLRLFQHLLWGWDPGTVSIREDRALASREHMLCKDEDEWAHKGCLFRNHFPGSREKGPLRKVERNSNSILWV